MQNNVPGKLHAAAEHSSAGFRSRRVGKDTEGSAAAAGEHRTQRTMCTQQLRERRGSERIEIIGKR